MMSRSCTWLPARMLALEQDVDVGMREPHELMVQPRVPWALGKRQLGQLVGAHHLGQDRIGSAQCSGLGYTRCYPAANATP